MKELAGLEAARCYLLAWVMASTLGCATLESGRVQSQFDDCISSLHGESRYARASATLAPAGGVTPSMRADSRYPSEQDAALYAAYLDARTQCERGWVEGMGQAAHADREKYRVRQKQYRVRWNSYANFLSGGMTYGEFFTEQERISEAKEAQIAQIERRQAYRARERRESVELACAAAGGRWTGWRCNAELGDLDRTISCTTTESMTTCNVP